MACTTPCYLCWVLSVLCREESYGGPPERHDLACVRFVIHSVLMIWTFLWGNLISCMHCELTVILFMVNWKLWVFRLFEFDLGLSGRVLIAAFDTGLMLGISSHPTTSGYCLHVSRESLVCVAHCFDEGPELSSCTLTLAKPPWPDLGLRNTLLFLWSEEDWLFNTNYRQVPLPSVDC